MGWERLSRAACLHWARGSDGFGILVLPACRSTLQRIVAANIFRRRVAPREIASNGAILPQLWEVSSVDRALYFFQFRAVLAGRGRPYEPNEPSATFWVASGHPREPSPAGVLWEPQTPKTSPVPAGVRG